MPVHGHVGQLVTVVGILVGAFSGDFASDEISDSFGSLGTQTVGVVGELPLLRGAQANHRGQLPAMLPGIIPGVIGQRIADLVVMDDPAVVYLQLIAPFAIIDIFRLGSIVCRYVVIGVDCPGQDITGVVISPEGCSACLLVIFPNQLVGRIVGVVGGMRTVADAGKVKGTENYPLDPSEPKSNIGRSGQPYRPTT